MTSDPFLFYLGMFLMVGGIAAGVYVAFVELCRWRDGRWP
jgi:hypothetical protein